jgi:aspartyl-tRNA(Asn)/glutamyl-tRNA(Gln) amidotransferase subunit A
MSHPLQSPSHPTDLADCTAAQLLALYQSGGASPVEATQAVLRRIERLNPVLNAFRLVDAESAVASARRSEARWLAHRACGDAVGTLEGVPTSIKDIILTKGWSTLRGSLTIDPDQTWEIDAPVTARLREAGAVLLGKTTTPEFGCKAETNSPLTGITRNPWHLGHTSGGSSGGAAAQVAAGMGPLAVGTDGAGSVRIPAAWCGNVGLKPSFGRVPAYPLSPFGTVAHLGPHAMSVADVALMMDVMKRPDARDWTSLQPDATDYWAAVQQAAAQPSNTLKGLRVAYSPDLGYVTGVDADIAAATADCAKAMASLGASVEEVSPGFENPMEISAGLWFAGAWWLWNNLNPAQQAVTDPDFASEARHGASIDALALRQLEIRRGELGSHMRQFMQGFDLLLTPSVAVPALPAGPAGHRGDYGADTFIGFTPFSYPFNLTQQPAVTLPWGLTRTGLPIGIQVVGPMFGDLAVLTAVAALEVLKPVPRPDWRRLVSID